jgi:hypothetical protein
MQSIKSISLKQIIQKGVVPMSKRFVSRGLGVRICIVMAFALLGAASRARALTNCACALNDVDCRPRVSVVPNLQQTRLSIEWAYDRPRCHDFYNVRFTVIGHAPEQREVKDVPFPCRLVGGANCGYTIVFNNDKPYSVSVEACASNFAQGSSCTGWSEPVYWLAHGPDTCKDGFVWREAFGNDHVCVTRPEKDKAAAENHDAPGRVQPGGSSGPDTCKSPFVWREADRFGPAAAQGKDHVCVPAPRRDEVWAENKAAVGNKARP